MSIEQVIIESQCTDASQIGVIVVSDYNKIVIDGRLSKLTLVEPYDTADDHQAQFPLINPSAVSSWDMVQVVGSVPTDDQGQVTGSIALRLHDGTTQYWWNGTAWSPATDPILHWNTAEVVNQELANWSLDNGIGIVVKLKTDDPLYTPEVTEVRVAYTVCVIDLVEDWVYNVVLCAIQDLEVMSDLEATSDGAGTITLALGKDYETWNERIQSVVGVWDLTTDPRRRTNLLASFDQPSKLITLTAPVPVGNKVGIVFTHKPLASIQASMDYEESAAIPSYVFTDIRALDKGQSLGSQVIINPDTDPPSAIALSAPRRFDMEFTIEARAPLGIDLMRMAARLTKWFDANRVLVAPTTAQRATLQVDTTFTRTSEPNVEGLHSSTASFKLLDINVWTLDADAAAAAVGALTINSSGPANSQTVVDGC